VPPNHIYDHLLTELRARAVSKHPKEHVELEDLDPADSHERIARHLASEIQRALSSFDGEKKERLNKQAALANDLLARRRELASPGPPADENLAPPPRLLLSVHDGTPPIRTELPFAVTTVLTRARGEPSIGHELVREIATAEDIDALVSFVTISGVRALREPLERHAQEGRRLRLLTTTYTGATDADAVEALARLPNVQVRISYDARRTRLHAKAWLFSRASGLDTAYVGSANLSSAALFHGHEWVVKISAADLPAVIAKFRGTFDTLWNDPEFEPFDASIEAHRERLRDALAAERGGGRSPGQTRPTFFTLKPYPFQAEILDRLQAERDLHGRRRNLVVAATGTGKTVVAAFDYQRRIGIDGLRPRLLFLAHREEILAQALATFRNVLRDGAFGELLVRGEVPARQEHLFASIQSFNSRELLDRLGADYWDHVVIDECSRTSTGTLRPNCGYGTRSSASCSWRSSTTASATTRTSASCGGTGTSVTEDLENLYTRRLCRRRGGTKAEQAGPPSPTTLPRASERARRLVPADEPRSPTPAPLGPRRAPARPDHQASGRPAFEIVG